MLRLGKRGKSASGNDRASGDFVLERIISVVAQKPAADVDGRRRRVQQLDPIAGHLVAMGQHLVDHNRPRVGQAKRITRPRRPVQRATGPPRRRLVQVRIRITRVDLRQRKPDPVGQFIPTIFEAKLADDLIERVDQPNLLARVVQLVARGQILAEDRHGVRIVSRGKRGEIPHHHAILPRRQTFHVPAGKIKVDPFGQPHPVQLDRHRPIIEDFHKLKVVVIPRRPRRPRCRIKHHLANRQRRRANQERRFTQRAPLAAA